MQSWTLPWYWHNGMPGYACFRGIVWYSSMQNKSTWERPALFLLPGVEVGSGISLTVGIGRRGTERCWSLACWTRSFSFRHQPALFLIFFLPGRGVSVPYLHDQHNMPIGKRVSVSLVNALLESSVFQLKFMKTFSLFFCFFSLFHGLTCFVLFSYPVR